ncbi:MAG: tetratricopeptide repeat protein [Candidatus Marinimicrobia bacterium]|nr:tetratricopeptide repeat protein [Candidatus Neomarinimicrobiota bacterium]
MKNFIQVDNTEEEQVEQIKKWWKSNGKQIIAGAVIGLAGIWGWNTYTEYQDNQSLNARSLYLNYASDSNNLGAYDKLTTDFSSSTYSDQAILLMAKYLFDAGSYAQALGVIKPLINNTSPVISNSAALRTASIQLQLGQHEQALSILEGQSDDDFSGLVYNLMGDIYLDLGNRTEAQKYYSLAIDNVTENSNLTQLIQIKLDDLN